MSCRSTGDFLHRLAGTRRLKEKCYEVAQCAKKIVQVKYELLTTQTVHIVGNVLAIRQVRKGGSHSSAGNGTYAGQSVTTG